MMRSEISLLRVGSGFDVHAFAEGRKLILGGIEIPHSHGLEGHSDADALIHAIVDALLGALSLGDIGHHFPPSDPKWKGAPSSVFLEYARDLIKKGGGEILSIDASLLLERPKIKDYVPKMRAHLAELLSISIDRISVKATTTEQLGFVGRGEGAAAHAVALVLRGGAS